MDCRCMKIEIVTLWTVFLGCVFDLSPRHRNDIFGIDHDASKIDIYTEMLPLLDPIHQTSDPILGYFHSQGQIGGGLISSL